MTEGLTRRRLTTLAAAAAAFAPSLARAKDDPITLYWEDLVPESDELGTFYGTLAQLGLLKIGDNQSPWAIQPPAAMVREYDDKVVRIPGFIVPLDFYGHEVSEGLLVPYVGACIHVPPPPANQIVFVRLTETTESAALWDPVWATGLFTTRAIETELADVGYEMADATLEPYRA